ncbi:hypothetical protein [Streptomyces chattanoogensis]|uniref:Uncharacterized protein n=1 Tax=Streptomyces chattanoogensis TaxID=66876 RepID=A0A0N0H1H1_9ACTN|nr:hypothetical protein [Streptomyces chattanoogensis]KPC64492.1 hypothetical protein ADL29_11415 [Streptomyces chattanoogensis]
MEARRVADNAPRLFAYVRILYGRLRQPTPRTKPKATEADRPAIEGLMATLRPEDLTGTRLTPGLRTRIDETLPDPSELQVAQA